MSSINLKRVRVAEHIGDETIAVTLYRDARDRVCGWYIGPVQIRRSHIDMAYLPASERTLASVAVVRAIEAARTAGLPVIVVDPDDLWDRAWQAEACEASTSDKRNGAPVGDMFLR